MTEKKLIGVWRTMHNRCYNQKQKSYPDYGGRGISVDARWHGAEGYKNFVADMGPCPDGHSIEREDNDANYGPNNCKWATRLEQGRNKRNNRKITAGAETKTLAEWARTLGCTNGAILARIKAGMTEQEAVTMPVPERPNSKLTEADVRYIRANYPAMTCSAIAAKVGVSKKSVLNVLHGRTFADVN